MPPQAFTMPHRHIGRKHVTTAQPARGADAAVRAWRQFRRWRRSRPFWGGLLTLLAGWEIFASTQMSLGGLRFQMGPTGYLSWLIPTVLVACGLLLWFTPQQRMFYSIVGVVTAVFSLIAVNLGGFLLGIALGVIGSALAFAWTPLPTKAAAPDVPEAAEPPDGHAAEAAPVADSTMDDLFTPATDSPVHADNPTDHVDADPWRPAQDDDGPAGPDPRTESGKSAAATTYWSSGCRRADADAAPVGPGGIEPAAVASAGGDGPAGADAAPVGPGGVEPADVASAGGDGPAGADPAHVDPAGVGPGDPEHADGDSRDHSHTDPPEGQPPPYRGGPLPRRIPRLFTLVFLVVCATAAVTAGSGATAVYAAPCQPTGRATPVQPTPTRTPAATPSPTPTATGTETPTPSATDAGTQASAVTGLVDGPTGITAGETTTVPAAASPTPTAPPTTDQQTPGPVPGAGESSPAAPNPGACAEGVTASPTPPAGSLLAPGAAERGQPRVARTPAELTGSTLTMYDLSVDGVVELPTVDGPMKVLRFSMTRAVTDGFALRAPGRNDTTLLIESGVLTVDGDVTFYATRFVGRLLGVEITLTPDQPIPADLPLAAPRIAFDDPRIQLAFVHCNQLTARPGMRQSIA